MQFMQLFAQPGVDRQIGLGQHAAVGLVLMADALEAGDEFFLADLADQAVQLIEIEGHADRVLVPGVIG
ncbi:ABC-type antimicrobial peptide transporter [Thiohalobacter thiocyanaticus]|uniref:ABC-type antimicrobial peptide transporter n=1 Tax=Thiohalobacter thiocyanaticus TaxID=585455 RepID=A0A1Z4VPV8_9GAMM|nr:ABC-type antimicrobial peptide transporter [Thiohalobacter thiocyanaticus]